jgi:hypothetical protein
MVELKRNEYRILAEKQAPVSQGDREALLGLLKALNEEDEVPAVHLLADKALLEYIGDMEITYLVESQERWYE